MDIPEFWIQAFPLVMIGTVFYCIVIRPTRRAENRRYLSVMDLKGGEKVVTRAGMLATVVSPGGKEVEIELSPGFRVTVMQEAIKKVLAPAQDGTGAEVASVAENVVPFR